MSVKFTSVKCSDCSAGGIADNTVYYEPRIVRSIVDNLMVKHYINMFEK